MKQPFFLLFLFFCLAVYAQDTLPVDREKRERFTFGLVAVNFGPGSLQYSTPANVQPATAFILAGNYQPVYSFGFAEGEFIYRERTGITVGLIDFSFASLDESHIRNGMQDQVEGYTVFFPVTDYENGEVPIAGGFKSLAVKAGLFHSFQPGKIAIRPFFNYRLPYAKNRYYVSACLTELSSGNTFRRDYTITERFKGGLNPGLDIRYCFKMGGYIGFRAEYIRLYGSANAVISDKNADGYEMNVYRESFSHTVQSWQFRLHLGITFI